MQAIELKPDLPRSIERFEAWWRRDVADRPPITPRVRSRDPHTRAPAHPDPPGAWLDAEYQVDAMLRRLEAGTYPADRLPVYVPGVGIPLMAALHGCELRYSATTCSAAPVVGSTCQWNDVVNRPADFANPAWRAVETMTRLAIERGGEKCLVAPADLHGNLDVLADLREATALCLDIVDAPDAILRALRHVAAGHRAARARLQALTATDGRPCTGWAPFLCRGAAAMPGCDFLCAINDEQARHFAIPAIRLELEGARRSLFHLDGPHALRHLELLLEVDELDAVQWVHGPGNGPAAKWIDVYRRILDAGKSIQVLAADAADALAVLDAVGPRGVWLCIKDPFASLGDVDRFVETVASRGA